MPENEEQNASFKNTLKISSWALKLILSQSPFFAWLYLGSSVFRALLGLLDTYILAKILDWIIDLSQKESASIDKVIVAVLLVFLVNIVRSLASFFLRYSRSSLFQEIGILIDREYYTKVNQLGIQTLEDPEINNKIARGHYIKNLPNFFFQTVDLIQGFIILLTTLLLLAKYTPLIIPGILLGSIPRLSLDRKFRKKAWEIIRGNTEENRKANASSSDLTNTHKLQEIAINSSFKFFDQKSFSQYSKLLGLQLSNYKKWFLSTLFSGYLTDLFIYLGYLLTFVKLVAKRITIGDTYFQINVIQRFSSTFFDFTSTLNEMSEHALRFNDLYDIFHARPVVDDGTVVITELVTGPKIEFRNVSFKYPRSEKHVIENLDLSIGPGEKVAIVGHNGAGKTTLVRLICRMYAIQQGKILINELDLNSIKIKSWYKNMGVLFQDFAMYPQLTAKENIFLGRPDTSLDEERIREAARMSDSLDFIEDFPSKFDQTLSEKYKGGIRPSTGQWQKIAIARFFYRNAPLVIFDEPTASIDAVSEYSIFNKIYQFFNGKTTIIISHRFSTVRNADRIIVLEKGKIVETGSHKELMSKDGYYAKAFRLQAEGYSKE